MSFGFSCVTCQKFYLNDDTKQDNAKRWLREQGTPEFKIENRISEPQGVSDFIFTIMAALPGTQLATFVATRFKDLSSPDQYKKVILAKSEALWQVDLAPEVDRDICDAILSLFGFTETGKAQGNLERLEWDPPPKESIFDVIRRWIKYAGDDLKALRVALQAAGILYSIKYSVLFELIVDILQVHGHKVNNAELMFKILAKAPEVLRLVSNQSEADVQAKIKSEGFDKAFDYFWECRTGMVSPACDPSTADAGCCECP